VSVSRPVKIALVVAGVLAALLLATAGAGFFWVRSQLPQLRATGEEAIAEGRSFAEGRNQSNCLGEALRRADRCDAMMCEVKNRVFLDGCLGKAERVANLCVGVPPPDEIMQSVRWALGLCQGNDQEANQRCSRLLQTLQRFCHPSEPKK
jgi:hypothetical protein